MAKRHKPEEIIAKLWQHLQIDRCLDLGGRWNYETSECEGLS